MRRWSVAQGLLFSLLVVAAPACKDEATQALEALQPKLDADLVQQQTLANNLNQFKRTRQELRDKLIVLQGVAPGEDASALLEAHAELTLGAVTAEAGHGAAIEGQGGGARGAAVVRLLAARWPWLLFRGWCSSRKARASRH